MNENRLRIYVASMAGLAVALASAWIYWRGFEFDARLAFGAAVLASLVLLGDLFPLRLDRRHTVGAWDIALVVAVAILGPTWAALAAIPSALFVGGRDWLRSVYEVGHSITIVYIAGLVFSFVSDPLLIDGPVAFAPAVYGTFVAGGALVVVNKTATMLLLKIKYDQRPSETWRRLMEPYLVSDALNVLAAGIGVLALLAYGPVAAVVAVGGGIGSQALVYRSRERAHENRELRGRVASLEEALTISNTAFGAIMIEDLGRRDGYTHRHASATAIYAYDLAHEMKLDEAHARRLRMAGLLHNVGMFGLPEDLLTATGRLNSIAQGRLAEHPAQGERVLASVPEFAEMARWVRWHHERPDGRGYPDKLRGAWIPIEAKILAVAQAYADEILDKPSRPGVSPAKARERLAEGVDTEFDGMVARAFLRILDTESEGYRMADDHRFAFPAPRFATDTPDQNRKENFR